MNKRDATAPAAVLVFARAPVAGSAKTRLIPVLGADGAAQASARLTRRALRVAGAARIGPVELWCAPDCAHAFFVACARDFGITLHAQATGDIGRRMARAFDDALRRHERVLLIGADAVSLDPAALIVAAHALTDHQAVFAPAEDGGYLLVGLRQPQPALFDGIGWGTGEVWSQTRARLDALGLSACVLATGYDVDRPQDWQRAVDEGLFAC